jgi:hypothetical protein
MEIRETRLIQEWLGKHGAFWKNDADNKVKMYFEETSEVDGVIRWNKSNNVPPSELMELWAYVGLVDQWTFQRSTDARDKDQAESAKRYRETRATQGYSQEQLFEMRAAFGAGTTVMDVITGKKIKL